MGEAPTFYAIHGTTMTAVTPSRSKAWTSTVSAMLSMSRRSPRGALRIESYSVGVIVDPGTYDAEGGSAPAGVTITKNGNDSYAVTGSGPLKKVPQGQTPLAVQPGAPVEFKVEVATTFSGSELTAASTTTSALSTSRARHLSVKGGEPNRRQDRTGSTVP